MRDGCGACGGGGKKGRSVDGHFTKKDATLGVVAHTGMPAVFSTGMLCDMFV